MKFTNLKDAIQYARENNMDVQKQGDKWTVVSIRPVPIIPPEKIVGDLQLAIQDAKNEENPNLELIQQMENDLKELIGDI